MVRRLRLAARTARDSLGFRAVGVALAKDRAIPAQAAVAPSHALAAASWASVALVVAMMFVERTAASVANRSTRRCPARRSPVAAGVRMVASSAAAEVGSA